MNIYTEIANTINKLTILQLVKQGVISPRGVAQVFGIPYKEQDLSELMGKTPKEISDIAESESLVAFFPKPNEVMLDIDEPFASAVIKMQSQLSTGPAVQCLKKNNIYIVSQLYTTSKSGNAHLYLQLSIPLTDMDVLRYRQY